MDVEIRRRKNARSAWFTQLRWLGLIVGVLGTLVGCPNTDDDDTGVESDEILGILVAPERIVLPLGESVQLTATGLLETRNSKDLTHVVNWVSATASVADVSNDLDNEGVVTGQSVGQTVVRATSQGIESNSVEVEVTEASLIGLSIEPSEIVVEVGQQVQLQAMAVFSDGNRSDAAAQVRWVTGDGAIATLAAGGLLSGASVGTTDIKAIWNDIESDATGVEVLQQANPDLTISQVSGESSSTDITLTVTVENKGTVGASSAFVDVFLDPVSMPTAGDYGDDWEMVEYVGPGGIATISFTLSAGEGNHQIVVLVDSDDSIAESNEGNNSFTTTIDVGSENSGPNLTVNYFDYVADDEAVYYAVDIYNSGSEDVGRFYVDLYLDEVSAPELYSDGERYVDVESLSAGGTEYADFLIEEPCNYCWSWILIDSYDEVSETDETDNISGPLTIIP